MRSQLQQQGLQPLLVPLLGSYSCKLALGLNPRQQSVPRRVQTRDLAHSVQPGWRLQQGRLAAALQQAGSRRPLASGYLAQVSTLGLGLAAAAAGQRVWPAAAASRHVLLPLLQTPVALALA